MFSKARFAVQKSTDSRTGHVAPFETFAAIKCSRITQTSQKR